MAELDDRLARTVFAGSMKTVVRHALPIVAFFAASAALTINWFTRTNTPNGGLWLFPVFVTIATPLSGLGLTLATSTPGIWSWWIWRAPWLHVPCVVTAAYLTLAAWFELGSHHDDAVYYLSCGGGAFAWCHAWFRTPRDLRRALGASAAVPAIVMWGMNCAAGLSLLVWKGLPV